MRFIHTADWQLGKPFARVPDPDKRAHLQQQRIEAIRRIGEAARERGAEFVVVAGDLFDSPSASKSTVANACGAIGEIGLPVFVIPGNHDHGGPGGIWTQDFFLGEQRKLAPNLRVLLEPEPVELDSAVLFPCPLNRRAETADTTAWLRLPDVFADLDPVKPRIVLAHGSTQGFVAESDDEETVGGNNRIDIDGLPETEIDYIALGDWHGTKSISPKCWYSGTPEPDRFAKGDDYRAGNVLLVEVERNGIPRVTEIPTGRLRWTRFSYDFADDASLSAFEARIDEALSQAAGNDLLQLQLTGSLGIEAASNLEEILDRLDARLLRLKLVNETVIAPTPDEIRALTERAADPLISRVATRLIEQTQTPGEEAAVAATALRELHAAVARHGG